MIKKEMIAMLLAGGQGSRLGVLTQKVAKPAVSFGGKYRIIDFPLSNCINSGVDTVGVLTQYQPLVLNEYIGNGQPWDLDRLYGGVHVLPPYQKANKSDWYKGTANAIYQNLSFIERYDPEYVIILSGDQICKQDYSDFLRRFMTMGETIQVNDDEFDYIYYTYGLSHYGNMPLVEPLEYKDANKIKDFVIAVDTSASCRGELVQAFLSKTYRIMQQKENFFRKINVHIIQCDSEVQSDTKITGEEDFEEFMKNGKLKGFGSTDFRPVFGYVEQLAAEGEFENLKGLIYFTDGYGIYPAQMPAYDTIFIFLDENGDRPELPPWAIGIVLNEDDIGA